MNVHKNLTPSHRNLIEISKMNVCYQEYTRRNLLRVLNSELKAEGIPPISRSTLYRWLNHPEGKTTDVGVKPYYTNEDIHKLKVFADAMFKSNSYAYAQHVLTNWDKENANKA